MAVDGLVDASRLKLGAARQRGESGDVLEVLLAPRGQLHADQVVAVDEAQRLSTYLRGDGSLLPRRQCAAVALERQARCSLPGELGHPSQTAGAQALAQRGVIQQAAQRLGDR